MRAATTRRYTRIGLEARMTFRLLPILVAFAIVGSAVPVWAADDNQPAPPPGLAFASSFMPVPAGTPINVRPWDNTTENQRVQSSFTEALHRRGVPLTERRAKLILNFETEVDSLAIPSDRDERVRMSLGSDSDGLYRRTDGSSGTIRYILRATLDDQQSGERLWQGQATYTGAVNDEAAVFAAMAPILVDGFGQNVRPKSFRIQ